MKTENCARTLLVAFVLLFGVMIIGPSTYNVEAWEPHICKGHIYEKNETDVWVVVDSASVTILNTRTGESTNTTANTTGYYAYNLLNLPSGWAYGDTIQVTGYNATNASGVNSTQIALGATNTTIDVYIGINQSVAGINFYITDEDAYPLDSALINVKDSNNDTVITKRTGDNGRASTTLTNGIFYITIAHRDFDDLSLTIRVYGPTNYAFDMREARAKEEAGTDYTWLLYLLAFIGILGLLVFAAKKVK